VHSLNEELMRFARTLHSLRSHVTTNTAAGVPWATFGMLFHLVTEGPRRAGELAAAAHVDASTASRQIDQLVRMGLVERQADPDDGRATRLVATDAGRQVHAEVRASRERMLADVLADWSGEDVDRLAGLLGRLNDDMTARLPDLVTRMTADSSTATSHLAGARP
jgi:DNA-binding MarR family transcriptional regulator